MRQVPRVPSRNAPETHHIKANALSRPATWARLVAGEPSDMPIWTLGAYGLPGGLSAVREATLKGYGTSQRTA